MSRPATKNNSKPASILSALFYPLSLAFTLVAFLVALSAAAGGATSAAAHASSEASAATGRLVLDTDSGSLYALQKDSPAGYYALPAALVSIVSVVGIYLIAAERKKARGMWMANPKEFA